MLTSRYLSFRSAAQRIATSSRLGEADRQLWLLQPDARLLQIVVPLVAGCVMAYASLLPWLKDPLGADYSAWNLPVDLGLQVHVDIFNYGLLCLCCAIYAFLVACANWRPFRGSNYFVRRQVTAGLLCLVPVALFLVQYLFIDVNSMNLLTQHMIQKLLIQNRFGYNIAQQRIALQPFTLDTSVLGGRLSLLANQISIGPLLPCLSSCMLIYAGRFFKTLHSVPLRKHRGPVWSAGLLLCIVLPLLVLGRAPVAMLCEYQARAELAAGDYRPALSWLDAALFLNPELGQAAYFHIERGQAEYFLQPAQQNDDTHVYLAWAYRKQGDYLDAYQELQLASHPQHTWVVSEMSITLERLAEFIQRPKGSLPGAPVARLDNDDSALPWVQLLTQVDPTNVYGHYVVGRLQYDLHNYAACMAQMDMVIQSSASTDVQSSAYTYIALSYAGQGDYGDSRILLFKAVQLDPNYYNNTAREELSGLH